MREFILTTNRRGSNARTTSLSEVTASSEIARITRTIQAGGGVGRMYFRATYWSARSIDGAAIKEGTVVHPIQRIGNTWYVVAEGRAPEQEAA